VLAMIVTLLAVWVPVLAGGMVLLLLPIVLFAVWRILAWRRKQRRAHEQKLQQARERIASSISHHADRMGAAAGGPPAASA
jgi:sensor domain CHASE-containing protein